MRERLALVAAAVALCGLVRGLSTAQVPTFSARVEQVRIDALVAEDGRPILGLTAVDFEVFDNGVPQSIEHVSVDAIPIRLVLVLDMSDSVAGNLLSDLRLAGRAALAGLRAGDQSGLITFSDSVSLAVPLTGDLAQVTTELDAATPLGGTALIDAAYSAMWVGEPNPGRGVLIVFSDGLDTSSWLPPERVLQAAKRSDTVVYGVSTHGQQGNTFLTELCEVTGGRVFDVSSGTSLQATFASILQEFRLRYVISYSPRGVAKPGWHKLELRVRGAFGRRVRVSARSGYLAGAE
jgi:Ca-activated chloride channel homolog